MDTVEIISHVDPAENTNTHPNCYVALFRSELKIVSEI